MTVLGIHVGPAWAYLILGGVAALFGLAVTPLVRGLAWRFGVIDVPGGRRVHAQDVPRLGGVAVFAATVAAFAGAATLGIPAFPVLLGSGWQLGWLLAGALLIVGLGAADDAWNIRPVAKLSVQVLAAGIAIAGGYGFGVISNPLTGGYISLGPLSVLATVIWIVGITNAFNLIDGLDGLAAGVALIACATVFSVSLVQNRPDAALVAVALGGALLGFLRYNFHPASIFLGDSGSLLLGYLLSLLSIQGQQKGPTAIITLVPILALGLPITDTLLTVWRRLLGAGPPALFSADREHIHHRLLHRGMSHRQAVLVLYAVCGAFGVLAFVAVTVAGPGSTLLIAVVGIGAYAGLRSLGYSVTTVADRSS